MEIIKKTINGVEYKAVWRGMAYTIECMEKCKIKGTDILSPDKLSEIVFDNIIVSPKVSVDDFGDMETFSEVFEFGKSVLLGTFEKEKTKSQLKKRATENWNLWRLVLSERGFDFRTVFGKPYMTPNDILEANIALEMQIEAEKKAAKKKH